MSMYCVIIERDLKVKTMTKIFFFVVHGTNMNGRFHLTGCYIQYKVYTVYIFQGGRCRQPIGERKNGHTNFRQLRICYICKKYVVFASNCKFANIIQYAIYSICNSVLLAQETLFFTQTPFVPEVFKKSVNHDKS